MLLKSRILKFIIFKILEIILEVSGISLKLSLLVWIFIFFNDIMDIVKLEVDKVNNRIKKALG